MNLITNYTFCHIPKTAGSSIIDLLNYDFEYGHKKCDKKNINNFLFTFVRNPYDRFISAFFYLKKGGNGSKEDELDSKKYVRHYSISKFIRTRFYGCLNQQHFRPQHHWIPSGADFVGKYENLKTDILNLSRVIDLKSLNIPHKNKTEYFYELSVLEKNIIYKAYKTDFKIFNYEK